MLLQPASRQPSLPNLQSWEIGGDLCGKLRPVFKN